MTKTARRAKGGKPKKRMWWGTISRVTKLRPLGNYGGEGGGLTKRTLKAVNGGGGQGKRGVSYLSTQLRQMNNQTCSGVRGELRFATWTNRTRPGKGGGGKGQTSRGGKRMLMPLQQSLVKKNVS